MFKYFGAFVYIFCACLGISFIQRTFLISILGHAVFTQKSISLKFSRSSDRTSFVINIKESFLSLFFKLMAGIIFSWPGFSVTIIPILLASINWATLAFLFLLKSLISLSFILDIWPVPGFAIITLFL